MPSNEWHQMTQLINYNAYIVEECDSRKHGKGSTNQGKPCKTDLKLHASIKNFSNTRNRPHIWQETPCIHESVSMKNLHQCGRDLVKMANEPKKNLVILA